MLDSVDALGYDEPTPIQREAIPYVLAGRDVLGCAQTGTGKTAAFVLPTLQRLSDRKGIKALVVTPTRELAFQVRGVADQVSKHTGHRVAAVYGGVGYQEQFDALRKGVDVLVATPGRLLDLQERGHVKLDRVEVLVLDEADRMLDMGFWPDVRRIMRLLPEKRQTLLFSATFSRDVQRAVDSTLHEPVRVDVGEIEKPVDLVRQAIYPVNRRQKADLLVALLKEKDLHKVLVFTATKAQADRLERTLDRAGLAARAMHSDKRQSQREKTLAGYRKGRFDILVATDVMARGIDVDEISHVINYDFPDQPEDYVHRIGRTARAGATGSALSFFTAEDLPYLQALEDHLGKILPTEDVEGFEYIKRAEPNPDRIAQRDKRTVFYSGVTRRKRNRRITR